MDLDKKRDFVKEIDDELDKSLNAGSLQEKSQKDGSNTLIAEENQLRAEVASLKNKNIKLREELQQQKKAILINSILRMNSSKMK
ncbi:unnamed protein product [Rhizophagus irregularis]|nr:unnamed protein product [Rhizophagus irregularis]